MEKSQEQLCAGVGQRIALLCASLGVLAALAIVYARLTRSEVGEALAAGWPAVAGWLAGLYLMAWVLGREAGRVVYEKRSGYAGAIFRGIGVALCSLALAAFLGTVAYAVSDPGARGGKAAGAIILISAYVMMFGFLPAVLLGALCGVLLRWRLTKAGC